ncbi:MAG: hypothetical protein ABI203_04355 [Mucilaginibacter sp.]
METLTAMSSRSLQYYVIAKHWASDIEFFKIETAFLHRLLDKYFLRLCERDYMDKLELTGLKLLKLEKEECQAHLMLAEQLRCIELMAEDFIHENADELAVNQVKLEYLINNLTNDYREVKKEMFTLVETVMKDDKRESFW